MTVRSHLTLKDYLRQVHPSANRQAGKNCDSSRFSRLDRFDKILSVCKKGNATPESAVKKGLTILDYMANPVRALLFASRMSARNDGDVPHVSGETSPKKGQVPHQAKRFEKKEKFSGAHDLSASGTSTETTDDPENARDISIRGKIDLSVQRAALRYRLPVKLIQGVIQAESGFSVNAVSPAGACGLMQLMPETARELGVQNIFDVEENVDGGAKYLRRMLDQFDGDVHQALMAYNAGPGTVRRYQGNVPYKETRQYVDRVLRFSGLNNLNQTMA